jgi:transposase
MREDITMSRKEANRAAVLEQLKQKQIKQKEAATTLGITTRHLRRIQRRYQDQGMVGLIHQSRGRASKRKIPQKELDRVIDIIKQNYHDFGPTLAHEKLTHFHGVTFGVDVLRQAMIDQGDWKAKKRRQPRIHQLRARRSCEGELVQLDGSPHDWFEGRGGMLPCTLLNAVDDATSKIEHAKFVVSENLNDYFIFVGEYFHLHGKPLAWYVDKHGVFRTSRTNQGQASLIDSQALTQFSRAMKQLIIEMIYANTPQAKGRVERSNQTLQDRLVKEMRLKKINTMKAGNQFLPLFIADYNRRFGVKPQKSSNLHRSLSQRDELDKILVRQEERTLSKNLTCQYQHITYQIQIKRPTYAMRHARVKVHQNPKGNIKIYYRNKELNYTISKKQDKSQVISSKQLNPKLDQLKRKTNQTKRQNIWDRATHQAWEEYMYA